MSVAEQNYVFWIVNLCVFEFDLQVVVLIRNGTANYATEAARFPDQLLYVGRNFSGKSMLVACHVFVPRYADQNHQFALTDSI